MSPAIRESPESHPIGGLVLETMEATQQFGKLIREHIQFDADG
jgi:hypothetical protein